MRGSIGVIVRVIGCLLLAALLLPAPARTQTPFPPPPSPLITATAPGAPNVSGTWSITRYWFRSCPACSSAVIRTTTWKIVQEGNLLRVDRGLRGAIEGNRISLTGIETDGQERYDFVYGSLYLSPDGRSFSGPFFGSETLQNPCDVNPPIVSCLVHDGYLYAVRVSPLPTPPVLPTWSPVPSSTPPHPTVTATLTPTTTLPPSPVPFRSLRLLPLVLRPPMPGR